MVNTPNPTENKPKKDLFIKAFSLAVEFGFIIAIPLVGFGLLGKYLDQKFHTHFLILIGILLALSSSTFTLYKRFQQIIKETKQK